MNVIVKMTRQQMTNVMFAKTVTRLRLPDGRSGIVKGVEMDFDGQAGKNFLLHVLAPNGCRLAGPREKSADFLQNEVVRMEVVD